MKPINGGVNFPGQSGVGGVQAATGSQTKINWGDVLKNYSKFPKIGISSTGETLANVSDPKKFVEVDLTPDNPWEGKVYAYFNAKTQELFVKETAGMGSFCNWYVRPQNLASFSATGLDAGIVLANYRDANSYLNVPPQSVAELMDEGHFPYDITPPNQKNKILCWVKAGDANHHAVQDVATGNWYTQHQVSGDYQ